MSTAAQATSLQPGFREFFDEHHAFVWRSVLRLGVPKADLDDVVQETFVVAARRLAEFEGRSSLRTWLFAIAAHVTKTHRRTHARRTRVAQASIDAAPRFVDPHHQTEAADLLHRLIAELDDDQRAAWIQFDLEGMTANEIAAGLGLNVNTVYSRVRSARAVIEAALARQQQGECT